MRQSTFFKPIPCERCAAPLAHPRWRRADFDEYRALCPTCLIGSDETFTGQGAIEQANAITMIARMITDAPARYCGVFDD